VAVKTQTPCPARKIKIEPVDGALEGDAVLTPTGRENDIELLKVPDCTPVVTITRPLALCPAPTIPASAEVEIQFVASVAVPEMRI